MFRGHKLKQRTVIDINTAEKIGYVVDVEIDEISGSLSHLIVSRYIGWWSTLFGIGEISLPWCDVTALSNEFVLVKSSNFAEKSLKNNLHCDTIK